MSFRFVAMTDGLVEPICTAFERIFGEARSPALWRQIYRASPDGAVGIVALDGANAVVGHFGATLHRFVGMGRDGVVLGQIRDVFTHPAARGAGTGRGSLFACQGRGFQERFGGRDVKVIFGFPSERHFRLGARLLGYRQLAGLTLWEREVPPPVNVVTERLGALAPVACFGDEVEMLWAQRPAAATMATTRTAAFLNWRFAPRPGRNYRCYRYDSFLAGGMAGYAVIAYHGHEARLADFCLPDDPDLRRDMWRQLLDRMGRASVRRMTLLASSAVPETNCLPSLGCVPLAMQLPWVPAYVPYEPEWRDCELGTIFHLTMADGDIF